MISKRLLISLLVLSLLPIHSGAQRTLTLEECRQMAIQEDENLKQARTKYEMAGYDKKIALANYFPNISATGAYMYNSHDISLISDEASMKLQNLGTAMSEQLGTAMQNFQQGLTQAIMSNPAAAMEFASSPMWQTVAGAISSLSTDEMAAAVNALGTKMDDALHLDITNVWLAGVSLQQPVFMGGKIIAANKIAALAQELQRSQYDQKYEETLVTLDQSYWQVVSLANKLKLAQAYADLLHDMEHNVRISINEGVATESDGLQIKVKANEADMLKTRAQNGLTLSKMLLCKQIGLDLNTPVTLADENLDKIPAPQMTPEKDMESIYSDRPETRSLELASQIYEKKVDVARADMLPQVALVANYMWTNPNSVNGFQNKFGGMFSAGVMLKVPIFHGFEALQKTRKAKAEATLYQSQLEDAKNLINLQVTQLRKQQGEAYEKLIMAESNLENAEENLRKATVGFNEGVVETLVTLQAQTAWLQAQSEYIDAGIELQMNNVNLMKAEGNYTSDLEPATK